MVLIIGMNTSSRMKFMILLTCRTVLINWKVEIIERCQRWMASVADSVECSNTTKATV